MGANTCGTCGKSLAPDNFDGYCRAHINGPFRCEGCGRFIGNSGHDCPSPVKQADSKQFWDKGPNEGIEIYGMVTE